MRGNENVLLTGPTDSGKTLRDASMNCRGYSGCGSPCRAVHSPRLFRDRGGRHAITEDDYPQSQGGVRLSEEKTVKDKMSAEEREILDEFERGELRSWS